MKENLKRTRLVLAPILDCYSLEIGAFAVLHFYWPSDFWIGGNDFFKQTQALLLSVEKFRMSLFLVSK